MSYDDSDQPAGSAGTSTTPNAPEPPQPRGPGVDSHSNNEDKLVAQIAAEDKTENVDQLYDQESTPQAPMLVSGDQKRTWLYKLKSPKVWFSVAGVLLLALIFAWLITPSRLWVLNTLGLRAQLDIGTLVAVAEGAPPLLKNAAVTINGKAYQTDDAGRLRLAVPYGPVHIVVSKQGYEAVTKDQLLDFDPFFHYLGGAQADGAAGNLSFAMKSVGIPVKFTAKDWLTGQPIDIGTFSVGDVVASPNPEGQVTMTIPATDAKTAQVTVKFGGTYTDTVLELPLAATGQAFTFVPAGKNYFLSKRSGQFAVYSSNIDGTSVTEVVPASANETGDIAFSASPSGKYGVLASTREGTRDSVGSVQQKLYVVDLTTNKLTALDVALRFNLADWSGDTLAYTTTEHSSGSATTGRVASVQVATGKQTNVASSGGFKVAHVSLASVVYITDASELRTAKLRGGGDKSLGTGILQFVQPDAQRFVYQIADHTWHQYDSNADQVAIAATPTSTTRLYLAQASQDGQTQLVVDTIDGQRALIAKKVAGGQEVTIFTGADLAGPIRWVGNVVVYRAGSADYAVSPSGGAAKKITDVSQTSPSINNDYFELN